MADSVKSPGIEISQVITETPVVTQTPTLAPCIVGPCYEVMEAIVEGIPNISSKISGLPYTQFPLKISASDFPTNNTTTSELVFDEDSIDASLVRTSGGGTSIISLDEDKPGSAFLTTLNIATRPAFMFNASRITLQAGHLYFRINKNAPVEIPIAANETWAEIAQKFRDNGFDACLHTVATGDVFHGDFAADGNIVIIMAPPNNSASYGAGASLTFSRYRASTDAMYQSWIDEDTAYDIRVEGSGLYVSPTDSSTLVLSLGNFYAGDFGDNDSYENDNQNNDWDNAITDANNVNTRALLLGDGAWEGNFTTSNTFFNKRYTGNHNLISDYSIKGATSRTDGDSLFVDGVSIGQISTVTASSMKIVTVDTASSQYNDDGSIIYQRYMPVDLSGVDPRYAYVRANNLGSTSASAASIDVDMTAHDYTAATKAKLDLFNFNLEAAGDSPGLLLKDTQLIIRVDEDGIEGQNQVVVFDRNYDGAGGITDLQTDLNAALTDVSVTVAATTVSIEATSYGSETTIHLISALEGSTANLMFRETAAADADFLANNYSVSVSGTDATVSTLPGETITLNFDYNPEPINVVLESSKVKGLVSQINDALFFPAASFKPDTGILTITSGIKGKPSYVSIEDLEDNITQFATITENKGSGRPVPELSIGMGGAYINITGQILRSPLTGVPLPWNNLGNVDIHVSYKALRLDVSTNPASGDAGLVKISSLSQLVAAFSPISVENPLALGIYYALINSGLDGTEISAIGVSDTSSAEPEGTLFAYQQALELISAHEVYALAPLTSSEEVIEAFDTHVKTMSQAENRAERVLISAPEVPSREQSTPVTSGTGAQSTGTLNTIQLDEAHADEMSSYIDALANPIPFSDSAYISININGEIRNYSIESFSGSNIKVRTAISATENIDGFFSTVNILAGDAFEGSDYTLFIRGDSLTIPGTSLLDSSRLATTVRNTASQYANRRQLRLFPAHVSSVISGVEVVVPSYYFAAAIAGDAASRPAQEPLTRNSLNGFSGVVGPKLSTSNLDIVAAGNAVIHVQREGEDPVIRMQCTTDADSIENREFSIVKAIDTFAKTLRSALRDRVGRFNITQDYLDNIALIVESTCSNAVNEGLLAAAQSVNIEQDGVQRDTLIVEVAIAVLYPANYIKLTIVV